jgi:hypothetical protein
VDKAFSARRILATSGAVVRILVADHYIICGYSRNQRPDLSRLEEMFAPHQSVAC